MRCIHVFNYKTFIIFYQENTHGIQPSIKRSACACINLLSYWEVDLLQYSKARQIPPCFFPIHVHVCQMLIQSFLIILQSNFSALKKGTAFENILFTVFGIFFLVCNKSFPYQNAINVKVGIIKVKLLQYIMQGVMLHLPVNSYNCSRPTPFDTSEQTRLRQQILYITMQLKYFNKEWARTSALWHCCVAK